jgi:hypothetical protein
MDVDFVPGTDEHRQGKEQVQQQHGLSTWMLTHP